VDFTLTEAQRMFQATAREVADQVVAPRAEETDATVLVVSEETSSISVASHGMLG